MTTWGYTLSSEEFAPTAAPTVSRAFCPKRARSRDNRKAPITAPTPSAPSSRP